MQVESTTKDNLCRLTDMATSLLIIHRQLKNYTLFNIKVILRK